MGCSGSRDKQGHVTQHREKKPGDRPASSKLEAEKRKSSHKKGSHSSSSSSHHSSAKHRKSSPNKLERESSIKKAERDAKQQDKGIVRKITDTLHITDASPSAKETRLIELLKKHDIDHNPHLGDHYTLYLDLEDNYSGVTNFIKEIDVFEYDTLKKLSIIGMHKLTSSDMDEMKRMLQRSKLSKLDTLYLHGGKGMGLSKMRDFMPKLLTSTQRQIYLDSFELSEEDLQMIIQNSTHTKNLSLINCKIGHLGDHFHIPKDQSYKMRDLDLFWTAIMDDHDYFNKNKLGVFLDALKGTKLEHSLKKIHVCDEDYPSDDFKDMFHTRDLRSYTLKVDDHQPRVYQ